MSVASQVFVSMQGWNSWNFFQCNTKLITEDTILKLAEKMDTSGLKDRGYTYVNIDDCWSVKSNPRPADQPLIPSPVQFPSSKESGSLKYLADKIHERGMKFGLYGDWGTATCQGYQGSQGFAQKDSETLASWDVDYLKLDGCNADPSTYAEGYREFSEALRSSGRSIVFSCSWPAYVNEKAKWKTYPWEELTAECTLWRLYGDIDAKWETLLNIIQYWFNDPDMLEIGNPGFGDVEGRTQMSIWAILAAPLLMGHDVMAMSEDSETFRQQTRDRTENKCDL
uniref:Alpha-galactosidase n=1 Tax=Chromera velia CCMP2878 TaxID=1169474 RepID=A0A0G4F7J7_9ALVE|eukprot:Cvel_15426.t1-p1 / transcript=Cvel_15426.t1 / gene=Cvel_15426 / organism=Chromera_velia_CCMP2878 / gene_product=Alpha-N-acetylgalactosaminidase, putative / transcript_product=Alpha-N-acetylgalactosaminidase, putative / location=Cvel_scaffold1140:47351-50142(-) / protein_length=281 / sequence_SO=supercontig / SO=protein_coding / is_pseudo=false